MSYFDNFDIDQISSKLAQRWHFVSNFHCKKNFTLGGLDDAKNAKSFFFLDTRLGVSQKKKVRAGLFIF